MRGKARLDSQAVKTAYRRWAAVYDRSFGWIAARGRQAAVELTNRLPGHDVLEVGVGTGLSLPAYLPNKRVTGIDLSADMLDIARHRVARLGIANVIELREMDAEQTSYPDASFDIVVAMFVASAVPNPERLTAEMKRLVRPHGSIVLVNHFAAKRGLRLTAERAFRPAARRLGWHPAFQIHSLLSLDDLRRAERWPVSPLGFFTLVHLRP